MDDVALVGGKAASLGELLRALTGAGVRVPSGFAVTARAYDAVLDQGQLRAQLGELMRGLDAGDTAAVVHRGAAARAAIMSAGLPASIDQELRAAYRDLEARLGAGVDVAVRSSATAEDSPEASFAGQQASLLNIRGEQAVARACLECFASLFTDRAITYRILHGFDHFAVRGAVVVQQMVRADLGSAGVIFTLDPESGNDRVVLISGAWGLGEAVVAGRVDPDEFLVFKPGIDRAPRPILRRRIGDKQTRIVYARTGAHTTRTVPVAVADRQRLCLDDADALQLARWAVAIEEHYSARAGRRTPMDIEWARDGRSGQLYIVQARPETVHARRDMTTIERCALVDAPEPLVSGLAIGQGVGEGPVRVIEDLEELPSFPEGAVLVTDMTEPDWVPVMRKAAAVVTNRGGRTCHAAIVSRELGIPCVVGTGQGTAVLGDGERVTVSCCEGTIGTVLPGHVDVRRERVQLDEVPALRTGVMLILADPDRALTHAALPVQGVGLARQEFIVANHVSLHPLAALHPEQLDAPTRAAVDALCRGYANPEEYFVDRLTSGVATIAAAFYPRPVIVRLGDFKSNEYARLLGGAAFEPAEENPMIGLRGASRYVHPQFREAFALECRALRRAREEIGLDNIRLMVPFCRTADEGRAVVAALAEHGLARGDGLEIWVMCELPSNVAAIDEFAEIFDGFSIGSNDLTQLVLGVDRGSALLAHLFSERDTAVRRTIEAAIRGAHAHGRPIGLCGQGPSDDPEFARFLVALGIDTISLNPDAVLPGIQIIADAEAARASAGDAAADQEGR